MMNIATSDQWSTGCESGWTLYLDDQSYISTNTHHDNVDHHHHHQTYRLKSTVHNDYDHDEDLSMVSDASSGPPHFLQKKDENPSYYTQKSSKKSRKNEKKKVGFNKNKQQYHHDHHHDHPFCNSNHHLDDTASSPSFSNTQIYANNPSSLGFSLNMSATHIEGNSSYSNHYAFWQSSQVNDANESSKPSQWIEGGWQQ